MILCASRVFPGLANLRLARDGVFAHRIQTDLRISRSPILI